MQDTRSQLNLSLGLRMLTKVKKREIFFFALVSNFSKAKGWTQDFSESEHIKMLVMFSASASMEPVDRTVLHIVWRTFKSTGQISLDSHPFDWRPNLKSSVTWTARYIQYVFCWIPPVKVSNWLYSHVPLNSSCKACKARMSSQEIQRLGLSREFTRHQERQNKQEVKFCVKSVSPGVLMTEPLFNRSPWRIVGNLS